MCHEFITPEKLSSKLARLWFDEIYVPGIRYLDGGLKGDYSEKEVGKFQDSFTEDEFKAVERFHHFFELRVEMIPASSRKSGVWPQSDSWSNVVKDAGNLLNLFALDADTLRSEIFEVFMQTLGKSLDSPDLRRNIYSESWTAPLTLASALAFSFY